MPLRRGLVSAHPHHPTNGFFAPSTDQGTRIGPTHDDEEYEPGSRFDSPESTPSTPSFSFTSYSSTSASPVPSPTPECTAFPPPQTTRVPSHLPTILPIPLPSTSSPPKYSSKIPRGGLRVDSSPTSPHLRPLPSPTPPLSRFHAFLLRAVPHRFLPDRITRSSSVSSSPPFQYPKSPSLLRPHPTTRHPSPRGSNHGWAVPKRWIVSIAFVLVLVAAFSTLPNDDATLTTARSDAIYRVAEDWVGKARGWRHASSGTGSNGTSLVDVDARLAEPERLELVRTGGQRIDRTKGNDHEGDQQRGRVNHNSAPATVVSSDDEEEQRVLNAVVEEAKKVLESELVEASAKETMVHKVIAKGANKGKVPVVAAAVEKPKKDPSRYKRLLALKSPSRRYLYGANFIRSAQRDDTDEVEVEADPDSLYSNQKKVKVPSKKTLEKLFVENKRAYEKAEPEWRQFEWNAPPPDQSLVQFMQNLTPEELSLRDWIRELYSLRTASGVGLGASTSAAPASPFSPLPPTSSSLVASAPSFASLAASGGSRTKYDELMVQAREGWEGKCRGSHWLDSYQKMHREMLEGQRDPKFISYHCEKGMNCGGLGDRLLGMTSAFFFGLITQRSFLGEWQSPIPLDVVFDSPSVNWSHSSFTSSRHPVLGQTSLVEQAADLDIIHFDRLSVDSTFGSTSWNPKRGKSWTKGFEKRDIAYASSWIKFFTNRGMIYRSFSYKHLQKSIKKLGLEPTTAFACINQYLFRPKKPALDLISEYTSVLALPSVFSVGIHVRTGDRSMKDSEYDKINTVKRHSQFFRCARELGETYADPSQRIVYYLVTDSSALKSDARRVLGSNLVTTSMVPQHVHQKSGHVDGVFSAVVEDWILSKTDYMVATQDSGFGKLASFMHARENTTVTIFPRFNEDVNGLIGKKSHLKVDCTDPNVFTTFEELSSEWSLG